MKTYNLLAVALGAALTLSACEDRTGRATQPSNTPAYQAPATSPSSVNVEIPGQQTEDGQPKSVDIALNPEHGMPGHRCEIPVGAPLTSQPSDFQNNNATTTQPSLPEGGPRIQSQPLTPGATTAKRLNPAHGEPGHDCNIAVGDPLPN